MTKIDLVISYYKENLDWLNDYKHVPFSRVFIYNKGPGSIPAVPFPYIERKLDNIGRCDHTYMYHIIENYDDLGEVTLFCTASLALGHKRDLFDFILNKTVSTGDSVFKGSYFNDVKKDKYNFALDKWEATLKTNNDGPDAAKLALASVRPFGKWYDKHFPNISVTMINYNGIFTVSNKHIHQRTKSYYAELIKEFPNHSNPEVGHYFERAWLAIFNPIPERCLYYKPMWYVFYVYLFLAFLLIVIFSVFLFRPSIAKRVLSKVFGSKN